MSYVSKVRTEEEQRLLFHYRDRSHYLARIGTPCIVIWETVAAELHAEPGMGRSGTRRKRGLNWARWTDTGFRVKCDLWQVVYAIYIETREWAARRAGCLARANYECQRCGAEAVQAHHRTYDRAFNEDPDDLEALCIPCHEEHHDRKHP